MQPPLVGNEAPDFLAQAVFDQEFIEVSLSQYKVSSICFQCSPLVVVPDKLGCLQGKYVVLFFYPLDFTFVCPTEITAFSDKHDQFEKLNAEVTCRHRRDCSERCCASCNASSQNHVSQWCA